MDATYAVTYYIIMEETHRVIIMHVAGGRRESALMAYEIEMRRCRFTSAATMARDSAEMRGALGPYECRKLEIMAATRAFDGAKAFNPWLAVMIARDFCLGRDLLLDAARAFAEKLIVPTPLWSNYGSYIERARTAAAWLREAGLTQPEIAEVGKKVRDIVPLRVRAEERPGTRDLADAVCSLIEQAIDSAMPESSSVKEDALAEYEARMAAGRYSGAAYIADAFLDSERTEKAARMAVDDNAVRSKGYALHLALRFGLEDRAKELLSSMKHD